MQGPTRLRYIARTDPYTGNTLVSERYPYYERNLATPTAAGKPSYCLRGAESIASRHSLFKFKEPILPVFPCIALESRPVILNVSKFAG
jgi:hypothetical protein